MSSDDGWILRDTPEGKYVLQHYSASADELPPIDSGGYSFDTIEEAILKFNELNSGGYPSEYGLSTLFTHTTKESDSGMLQTEKYSRNPFFVDAVQITADNMEKVAEWCQGDVRTDTPAEGGLKYVHVRVHRPLNERQTKGYVTDWVLYAGTGYKVYTDKAFKASFQKVEEGTHNVFSEAS